MVQAWRNGAEVVTAVRDDRDAEGLVKVATASWFYRVFNRLGFDSAAGGCRRFPPVECSGGGGRDPVA